MTYGEKIAAVLRLWPRREQPRPLTFTAGLNTYMHDKALMLVLADPVLSAFGPEAIAQHLVETYLATTVPGTRTVREYAAWLPGALVRTRAMANA